MEKKQRHFNWGFHDGAREARHGNINRWASSSHPDAVYKAGYTAGYNAVLRGEGTESSQFAFDMACLWGDI